MKPYYYIFKSNGYPPSRRHDTLESAEDEAKRLAEKHVGQAFEILQCIGITSTPITSPSTYWLDKKESEVVKYKSLKEGDKLQEDDEFWTSCTKTWVVTKNVGCYVNDYNAKMYRRPIK